MKRYKGEIEYKTKQRKATTAMPNKDVTQSNRAPLRHEERENDIIIIIIIIIIIMY